MSSEIPVCLQHILVVGFHHARGPQVEFIYPPLEPHSKGAELEVDHFALDDRECHRRDDAVHLPDQWKTLPFLAMPDGIHQHEKDVVYLLLPSCKDSDTLVYGLGCFRQIDSHLLKVKSLDITRSRVQKSVVLLLDAPYYTYFKDALDALTVTYFGQLDFSDRTCLIDFHKKFHCLLPDVTQNALPLSSLYLHTPLATYTHAFKFKFLVLFKLLFLERKVLVYGEDAESVCLFIFSLLSLLPGVLESRHTEFLSPPQRTYWKRLGFPLKQFLVPPPFTSDDSYCPIVKKTSNTDKIAEMDTTERVSIEGESNRTSVSKEDSRIADRTLSKHCISTTPSMAASTGMTSFLFTLQESFLLKKFSWCLVGSMNAIFLHHLVDAQSTFFSPDVIVNVTTSQIEVFAEDLKDLLHLSSSDKRFIEEILQKSRPFRRSKKPNTQPETSKASATVPLSNTKDSLFSENVSTTTTTAAVTTPPLPFEGSAAWIKLQFEKYLVSFLSTASAVLQAQEKQQPSDSSTRRDISDQSTIAVVKSTSESHNNADNFIKENQKNEPSDEKESIQDTKDMDEKLNISGGDKNESGPSASLYHSDKKDLKNDGKDEKLIQIDNVSIEADEKNTFESSTVQDTDVLRTEVETLLQPTPVVSSSASLSSSQQKTATLPSSSSTIPPSSTTHKLSMDALTNKLISALTIHPKSQADKITSDYLVDFSIHWYYLWQKTENYQAWLTARDKEYYENALEMGHPWRRSHLASDGGKRATQKDDEKKAGNLSSDHGSDGDDREEEGTETTTANESADERPSGREDRSSVFEPLKQSFQNMEMKLQLFRESLLQKTERWARSLKKSQPQDEVRSREEEEEGEEGEDEEHSEGAEKADIDTEKESDSERLTEVMIMKKKRLLMFSKKKKGSLRISSDVSINRDTQELADASNSSSSIASLKNHVSHVSQKQKRSRSLFRLKARIRQLSLDDDDNQDTVMEENTHLSKDKSIKRDKEKKGLTGRRSVSMEDTHKPGKQERHRR